MGLFLTTPYDDFKVQTTCQTNKQVFTSETETAIFELHTN